MDRKDATKIILSPVKFISHSMLWQYRKKARGRKGYHYESTITTTGL